MSMSMRNLTPRGAAVALALGVAGLGLASPGVTALQLKLKPHAAAKIPSLDVIKDSCGRVLIDSATAATRTLSTRYCLASLNRLRYLIDDLSDITDHELVGDVDHSIREALRYEPYENFLLSDQMIANLQREQLWQEYRQLYNKMLDYVVAMEVRAWVPEGRVTDRNVCFVHALENVASLRIAKANLDMIRWRLDYPSMSRRYYPLSLGAQFFVKHVAERGNKRGSNADCTKGLIDVIGFNSGTSGVSMVHEHDDDYHYYTNSHAMPTPSSLGLTPFSFHAGVSNYLNITRYLTYQFTRYVKRVTIEAESLYSMGITNDSVINCLVRALTQQLVAKYPLREGEYGFDWAQAMLRLGTSTSSEANPDDGGESDGESEADDAEGVGATEPERECARSSAGAGEEEDADAHITGEIATLP